MDFKKKTAKNVFKRTGKRGRDNSIIEVNYIHFTMKPFTHDVKRTKHRTR